MLIFTVFLPFIGILIILGLIWLGMSSYDFPEILQEAGELVMAGKFAEAVALYEKAPLDIIHKKPEFKAAFEHAYGMALFCLAKATQQTATLQKSLGLLNSAVNGWEQLNRKYEKALVLIDLSRANHLSAIITKNSALLEQTLRYLNEALKIPAIKKSTSLSAIIHLYYGMILLELFQCLDQREYLDRAVTLLESAWQYYRGNKADENAALAKLYLSVGYRQLSRFTNESVNFQKAFDFAGFASRSVRPDRDPIFRALLEFNLGKLYLYQADQQNKQRNLLSAFHAFKLAARFYNPQIMPVEYASSLVELCKIYQYFGKNNHKPYHFQKAIRNITQAITLIPREHQLYLSCLLIQGSLYSHLADWQSPQENLTHTILLYTEAINHISRKKQADIYTAVCFKTGVAYYKLAEYTEPIINLANAVTALENAFRVKHFATESDYLKARSYLDDAQARLEAVNATAENYRQLIQALQNVLDLYESEEFPEEHARFELKLGVVYQQSAAFSDPKKNLESAISHLEKAGEIYRRLHLTKKFGVTLVSLGNIYLEFARLENTEANLDKAIRLYNQAQQILAATKFSKEHVGIQIGLGAAYRLLAHYKNRLANLKSSIRALETAFNTLDAAKYPREFLQVLCELGFTHSYSVDYTEPRYHLTKAAEFFKDALKLASSQVPCDITKIKYEYANVLMKLADYNQASQNLREAIDLFEALREYYQENCSIEDRVLLLNQLALCYQKLSEVLLTHKKDNLLRAINILEETLNGLDPKENRLDYAMTQNNLGIAYSSLAKISNRDTNLQKARCMFEQAFAVYTPDTHPEEHRKIKINLEKLRQQLCGAMGC